MSSSVSFRITRTAEDLAQTITALTQRLVKLEQRQEALSFSCASSCSPSMTCPMRSWPHWMGSNSCWRKPASCCRPRRRRSSQSPAILSMTTTTTFTTIKVRYGRIGVAEVPK